MSKESTALVQLFYLRHKLYRPLLIIGSAVFCIILSFTRLPGMDLLDIGPNWFLIWVVIWSLRHNSWQATIAGLIMGWIKDGLTYTYPTHLLSLGIVAFLVARLGKNRYLRESFIALVFITFVMVGIGEGIIAIQYLVQGTRSHAEVWHHWQQITLSSALLSSLWIPFIAYPFNSLWEKSGEAL